jgi:uncharacterized membrane protein
MNSIGHKLNLSMKIVAFIGLLDALYLTWVKLSHNESACLPGVGNCETVNTSRYATIYGIPIAVLGAGAFLTILLVLFLENRKGFWIENSGMIIFGLSLIGVLYSAYLTYLELAVIHAICPFCVLSAVAVLLIFAINLVRLTTNQADPH